MTFEAGAVVAPDPDDEGVFELPHVLDRIQQPADVMVGVLRISGIHLHLVGEEALAVLVEGVPGRHLLRPRGQLCISRDHSQLLLARERLFT